MAQTSTTTISIKYESIDRDSIKGRINLMLLIILGAILRVESKITKIGQVFIRYFDQYFWMLQNALGPMLFDILPSRKTHSTFSKNLMFLIILRAVLRK